MEELIALPQISSPDPLAVFKGPRPTSKGTDGKGRGERGREGLPPQLGSLDPPVWEVDVNASRQVNNNNNHHKKLSYRREIARQLCIAL